MSDKDLETLHSFSVQHKKSFWPNVCCPQGERGEVGPSGTSGFAGPPVSKCCKYNTRKSCPSSRISLLHKSAHKNKLPRYWPSPVTLPPYRALTVSPEQEASVDLVELREKLAPLDLLDLLDSLDPLLVPFTHSWHCPHIDHDTVALLLGKSNLTGICRIVLSQHVI